MFQRALSGSGGGGGVNPQTINEVLSDTAWSSPKTLNSTLTVGKTYSLVFGIYGSAAQTIVNKGGIDFTSCSGMNILNVSYSAIGTSSWYYTAAVVTFEATATTATLVLSPNADIYVTNYTGESLVQLN